MQNFAHSSQYLSLSPPPHALSNKLNGLILRNVNAGVIMKGERSKGDPATHLEAGELGMLRNTASNGHTHLLP